MFDQWSRRSARSARSFIILCTLAALALAPSGAAAQDPRGTIQGRVVDASGAAIPGATVDVLNIATGVVTPTTTNEQGSYRVGVSEPGHLPGDRQPARASASSSATTSSCTSRTC